MMNNESRRYWAHNNAKHWTCNVGSGLTRGWILLWARRTLDYRCLSTSLEIQQGRMINGINYINNLKCIKMSSVAFYWISSFIVLVSWKKIQNHFICFFITLALKFCFLFLWDLKCLYVSSLMLAISQAPSSHVCGSHLLIWKVPFKFTFMLVLGSRGKNYIYWVTAMH